MFKENVILFIDFMNYLHRCRVGPLNGEFVLVYNFFRNLRATIEQFCPDKLFIVLDGYPIHRYNIYSDYKSNRIIKTASNLSIIDKVFISSDVIKSILMHLPVTILSHSDFEADDIISSMIDNIKEENTLIISSDADYTQLLQKQYFSCHVFNPISKEFRQAPSYPFIAFRSLVGDKSDGIKRLVSDKKALQFMNNPLLFQNFMSIEENRASFSINKKLIEFASVPLNEIVLHEGIRNFDIVKQEFARMDFQSIINEKSWEKFTSTFDCLRY